MSKYEVKLFLGDFTLTVKANYSPGHPGTWYRSNGDPGHPPEPPEIDYESVILNGSGVPDEGIEITFLLAALDAWEALDPLVEGKISEEEQEEAPDEEWTDSEWPDSEEEEEEK